MEISKVTYIYVDYSNVQMYPGKSANGYSKMELIIPKKRIKKGNSIFFSKRMNIFENNDDKWCPTKFSKLLRHISEEKFEYSISKANKEKERFIYLKCSDCKNLILVIRFKIDLSKIKVQINHVYYHISVKEMNNNFGYNYVIFLKK